MEEFEDIMNLKDKAYRRNELEDFYERLKENLDKIYRVADFGVLLDVKITLKSPIFDGFANYVGKEITKGFDCNSYCYNGITVEGVPF